MTSSEFVPQCAFSGFTIAKTSTSKTGSESGTRLGDATHATQLLINEMANTALTNADWASCLESAIRQAGDQSRTF